jgi:ATP adenylyltransferase/5',5'''-P-1,P-4-tetraphosphate phosphorylase II
MLSQKTFSQFPGTSQLSLHELSRQLYADQQQRWPMLAGGVTALRNVQTRTIDCGTFSVRLQYNPKRIVSTGASVDAASIKERKCFLCEGHLPPEQQGVLYNEKFLILCNPMPIFSEHFTISHIDHIPQSIEEQILSFLSLAKDLSPHYSVFYNGPKCGASAPDHMHFQAAPAGLIPVEQEIYAHKKVKKNLNGITVSSLERYGRSVIVLEGKSKQEIELTFLRLTAAMRNIMKTNEEPMMNVVGSHQNESWRLIVFVRSKHRPSVYFNEGERKVLISPASVDIGGLVVTPVEKDFRTADAALITEIYEEISVSGETLSKIIEKL